LPSTSVPRRVADVGYTMVCFTDLADRLGVPTPLMDAIIKNHLGRPGTRPVRRGCPHMKTLGPHELSTEQLLSL
jgi:hypothetical protein